MAFAVQPPLEIEEMTGPRRKVVLGGRCAPTEGIQVGGEQRHDITWNPGSPEATLQVFGSSQEPTTLKGKWQDRYMSGTAPEGQAKYSSGSQKAGATGGQQIESAGDLANVFDSIKDAGQILRLSWHTIVRYGVLTKFTFKFWPTVHDVEWDATFTWMSKDRKRSGPTFPQHTGVQSIQADFDTTVSAFLEQRFASTPVPVQAQGLLSSIDNGILKMGSLAGAVKDTVSSYAGQVLSASATLRRTLGYVAEGMQATRDLVENTQATVYAELLGYTDIAQATVGQSIAMAAFLQGIGETGGTFKERALLFQQDANQRFQAEIIAKHTCKQGDDLRVISMKYYHTENGQRRIMLFNEKDTQETVVGEVIYVPRLQRGQDEG